MTPDDTNRVLDVLERVAGASLRLAQAVTQAGTQEVPAWLRPYLDEVYLSGGMALGRLSVHRQVSMADLLTQPKGGAK